MAEQDRHCILLWMSGGPSQTDTWDLKPGHENGGEFQEIQTASPGLRISEHFPELAKQSERIAVIRGLNTAEGDHGRGTYLMRTGHVPMGPVDYPSIGATLGKQLRHGQQTLPNFVSIGPYRVLNRDAFGSGFLGPRYGSLIVGASDVNYVATSSAPGGTTAFPDLKVDAIDRPVDVSHERLKRRLDLLADLQRDFLTLHADGAPKSHQTVYQSAVSLMSSDDANAFDLTKEPDAVRERYGAGLFGQGCLMARRLVERGVAFVEVSLGTSAGGIGWDTHSDNFNAVRRLSLELDQGWSSLMMELDDRGLLESTTILCMGEFGRTPVINASNGRDHFPAAWSCAIAGGGIRGGGAYGKTSADGMEVTDGQVGADDVQATLCRALGLDPAESQMDPNGRPIAISEGRPIKEVLS
ncbi:MAG: DUF1501 domain-containing protein [Planctomycetota bacterium]